MLFCGIDLVEIDRIKKATEHKSFLDRVYSDEEKKMFINNDKFAYASLAANFAAKEAFVKMLGTGFCGIAPNEITVLRNKSGAPYITLCGNAERIVNERKIEFSVSLTHTKTTAAAVVTGTGEKND